MEIINKLQKIDESLTQEHSRLEPGDQCYFIGEYASGQQGQHSEMNQLIINFKKPLERKNHSNWRYKEEAIQKVANLFLSINIW